MIPAAGGGPPAGHFDSASSLTQSWVRWRSVNSRRAGDSEARFASPPRLETSMLELCKAESRLSRDRSPLSRPAESPNLAERTIILRGKM